MLQNVLYILERNCFGMGCLVDWFMLAKQPCLIHHQVIGYFALGSDGYYVKCVIYKQNKKTKKNNNKKHVWWQHIGESSIPKRLGVEKGKCLILKSLDTNGLTVRILLQDQLSCTVEYNDILKITMQSPNTMHFLL